MRNVNIKLKKAGILPVFFNDVDYKKYIFYNISREGESMDEKKRIRIFDNRPLTYKEKKKLHELEQEVIRDYEYILKRPFMKDDLLPMKRCLKAATPAQIKSMMFRFKTQKNFIEFFYLVKPCEQMFKNKRGGKKHD